MSLEIFLQNAIFLSLFFSTITFWWTNEYETASLSEVQATKNELDTRSALQTGSAPHGAAPVIQRFVALPQFLSGLFDAENVLSLSFFLLTAQLIDRWYSSGHPPLSNLYESLLFLIWGTLTVFFLTGTRVRPVQTTTHLSGNLRKFTGAIISSVALFIQTFASWRLPDEMREIKPLIPALQSNWLLMHVSIMILSYAALLVGCLLAISYCMLDWTDGQHEEEKVRTASLSEYGEPRTRRTTEGPTQTLSHENDGKQETDVSRVIPISSTGVMSSIPSFPSSLALRADLDSLSYRVLAFGFPLLTLGILSGAVWANQAWGSYWSWDPKETWAFITWLIFAFYLHTRLQYGWEGKKSAYVASFGFFVVWICYLGVNLLGKGLHSYGWLN